MAQTPQTPPSRSRALARLDRVVGAEHIERAVYGIIVIGALMAAESGHHESHAASAASAVIAGLLTWGAHAYANALGRRLAAREPLHLTILARALIDERAVILGSLIPVLALLSAWAAGASGEAAVSAALWSVVVSVVALELAAGLRARATRRELAFQAAVGATMGLGIIALKIVLHP